ncbi:hypothetical protein RJ640_014814 [Escallonia rubra]|uniref:Uncharacterized protein n=1 Tax=Escallonia rubra TaxID=112253 RepID=A0AA88R0X1_9ASTE|nr:hypothetical protein RJ640_014814 [Escallonia rubra]
METRLKRRTRTRTRKRATPTGDPLTRWMVSGSPEDDGQEKQPHWAEELGYELRQGLALVAEEQWHHNYHHHHHRQQDAVRSAMALLFLYHGLRLCFVTTFAFWEWYTVVPGSGNAG